jgi:DNA-binding NarL/FixJ family response regulator
MTTIRIVIVDDHAIVREGIRQVFVSDPGIDVVGEASEGQEALDLVLAESPDVVLLDITMPGMSGVDVARALRERGSATRVLMLSVHDDTTYVLEAVRKGAHGYVRKDTTPADLRAAVRAVHAGDAYFSPAVAKRLAEVVRDGAPRGGLRAERATLTVASLTNREREVLAAIARGLLNKEVASELGISIRTVEAHRESIMRKLGVRSVAAMTRAAIDAELIPDSH